MTRRFLLLIIAFCVVAQCKGQGTIQITFDGPPPVAPGTGVVVTNYFESGLLFQPLPGWHGFARHGAATDPRDPDNGTAYLQAGSANTLMLSFTNGSLFGLFSVDLAEYSTVLSNAVTVPFIGYQQGGSMVTNVFTTDGIIDGTGPLPDFQTFYFTNFTDLTRVEIPTWGWSLDNLVVSVPEPASGVLLLAGGALLWRIKRRN